MNSQRSWRNGWQFVCWTELPIAARIGAKKFDELMWSAISCRFLSFHAGSVLWKTPGVGGAPYQPTPKPSPFVGSAPSPERKGSFIKEERGPHQPSLSPTAED